MGILIYLQIKKKKKKKKKKKFNKKKKKKKKQVINRSSFDTRHQTTIIHKILSTTLVTATPETLSM
jgi:hypothetical protein